LNKLFFWGVLTAMWNFQPHPGEEMKYINNIDRDTLPAVTFVEKADVIALSFEQEAALDFELRKLPSGIKDWENEKGFLRKKIWKAAGVTVDHNLPLDYHETGTIKSDGYTIKKIYFQTREGVYATANLYVPDGKGPFPAVVNLHGHWEGGKAGEMVQSCAHELALNGYVCLNIDAWGSGERTTVHGVHEYHGSNLGASLINIGETLLGAQLADNIRGVDLLCSLGYVDKNRIGATGASGGGNQTMWLSAMDDRIKACMPVVSVGTFQAYIMASNCVCEMLPTGLAFTEESGVLSLIAPRALKIASALQDKNKAFFPSEMLRSFTNAKHIYKLYDKAENISYSLFDTPHGYWPAMRETVLGWFALHLKGEGDGNPVKEKPFQLLSSEELMVFAKGKRNPLVRSTIEYSKRRGMEELMSTDESKAIGKDKKVSQLRKLTLYSKDELRKVHIVETNETSEKIILETNNRRLTPLLLYRAKHKERPAVLVLFTDKNDDAQRKSVLDSYFEKDYNVVVADLWGLGINNSSRAQAVDGSLPPYHTLARASLWLGHSVQGIWADEIRMLIEYMKERFFPPTITVDAERETALAALIQSDIYNNTDTCILRTCPVSYIVDDRNGIDYFDMSVHLPGIIPWGDVSLLTALSGCKAIEFQNPVSLSGKDVMGKGQYVFEERVKREMTLAGTMCSLRFIKK